MTLRKYVYKDSVLSKVKFENKVTYTEIKIVIIMIVNVARSVLGVLYQLYIYVQGQRGYHDIADVCD